MSLILRDLNEAIVEQLTDTAGSRYDVLDLIESALLVPVQTKLAAQHFWRAEAPIESNCVDFDIGVIVLKSLEILRCHDEVHGDELLR